MSKHTPGPWHWDGNPCDYDVGKESPWLVELNKPYPPVLGGAITCTNEANARLIAAAPELLETLKTCERNISLLMAATKYPKVFGGWLEMVQAAIAKATGDQP